MNDRIAVRAIEAAKMLGLSVRQIENLKARGELPHAKVGTSTLYPVAGLREFVESRLVQSKEDPSDATAS